MCADHERRRHPRVQVDGRMAGHATVLAGFRIVALSETGATLELDLPLAMGSICDLTVDLVQVCVDVKGRVVRVAAPAAGPGPWRVDVEFVGLEAMDQTLLGAYLERQRRSGA